MMWKDSILFSIISILQIPNLSLENSSSVKFQKTNNIFPPDVYKFKKQSITTLFDMYIPTAAYPTDPSILIDEKCIEDSRLVLKAILNQTEWALSMLQASGTLPSHGSKNYVFINDKEIRYELGLFDQCISSGSQIEEIKGQYCSVFIKAQPLQQPYSTEAFNTNKESESGLDLKIPRTSVAERQKNYYAPVNQADIVIGLCLPSSCSAQDVRNAVAQKIGKHTFHLVKKNREFDNVKNQGLLYSLVSATHDRFCYTESKIPEAISHDGLYIAFMITLSFMIGLVLISAVYEARIKKCVSAPPDIQEPSSYFGQESTTIKILNCYSPYRNVQEWLSTKCSPVDERMLNWKLFPISNGTIFLEIFFVISGLLTYNAIFKQFNSGRFNIFLFYLYRFLRFTPLYSFVLFFAATVPGRLGSGPHQFMLQYQSEECRSHWFSHLLYINNFFPTGSALSFCMPETWSLAVDMQLFVLSPLFVYPLWRWQKKGLAFIFMWISAALCYTMIVHMKWDVPLLQLPTRPSMLERAPRYFQFYYVNTFHRCPSYLVGILLGWILNKTKNLNLKLEKSALALSWILPGLVFSLIIYGPFPYADETAVPVINPLFELIYGGLHRIVWSTALSWVIFLCAHGHGGIFNDFLSSKKFLPFSRLGYAVYFVNVSTAVAYATDFRTPYYITSLNTSILCLGLTVVNMMLSIFLLVVIEMPFRNLQKLLISPATLPSSGKKQSIKKDLLITDSKQKLNLLDNMKKSKEN